MPSQLLWDINLSFERLSPCKRQIIYVLRTRAPVASDIATLLPLDLHVLGLPLAFILSQDQTLHCKKKFVPQIHSININTNKAKLANLAHFIFYYLKDVMLSFATSLKG